MTHKARRLLEDCMAQLQEGSLTAIELQAVIDALDHRAQDLLYLQCGTTSVTSAVMGVQWIADGQVQPEPESPDDFPYQTVLEAIQDGWRVIQFPNLALLLDEKRTYGLGCEFILER